MPTTLSAQARRAHLARLPATPVDLVVIGGGITGAGVAWEAALRGLSVVVLDKGDFASGTSSKSSKLLHGGFRYLEHGEIKLVFESLSERNRLFADAPHVAKKLPFLFPVFAGGFDKGPMIGAGLWVYDTLSALSNWHETRWHDKLSRANALAAEPALAREGFKGAYRYQDGVTEDARLVIETVKSATRAGAIALNYCRVTHFTKDEDGRVTGVEAEDLTNGQPFSLTARCVFNAAGPWVDSLLRLDQPTARRHQRPTKGVHLIVESFVNDHAVVLRSRAPEEKTPRVLFVIPWQGRTLIGTTDTGHAGDPNDFAYLDEEVYATPEEIRYLLDAVNAAFEVKLTEADVIATYAGWRPLIAPDEADVHESAISRDYEIFESPSGLLSIAGGKLTAYRGMARQAVERVVAFLGQHGGTSAGPSAIETTPLSGSELAGGTLDDYVARVEGSETRWPRPLVSALVKRYGTNWPQLRDLLEADGHLARPLPGLRAEQAYFRIEVAYAARHEGALGVSDFLARRTRLQLLDADQGLQAVEAVAAELGASLQRQLGWTSAELEAYVAREAAAYRQEVHRNRVSRAWPSDTLPETAG